MVAKFVTVFGALSGRRAIVIVPPFSSVMTALLGAFANWNNLIGQGLGWGIAVARAVDATGRVGVGVGAAAVLPQAVVIASVARSANHLIRS